MPLLSEARALPVADNARGSRAGTQAIDAVVDRRTPATGPSCRSPPRSRSPHRAAPAPGRPGDVDRAVIKTLPSPRASSGGCRGSRSRSPCGRHRRRRCPSRASQVRWKGPAQALREQLDHLRRRRPRQGTAPDEQVVQAQRRSVISGVVVGEGEVGPIEVERAVAVGLDVAARRDRIDLLLEDHARKDRQSSPPVGPPTTPPGRCQGGGGPRASWSALKLKTPSSHLRRGAHLGRGSEIIAAWRFWRASHQQLRLVGRRARGRR